MSVNTVLYNINPEEINQDEIIEIAEIVKKGGLVAVPTETVYGLGADATNPLAAKKIYAAKGRPSDNPLIVHISDIDMLEQVVSGDVTKAKILGKHFWPGPLTIILKKGEKIPYATTGGLDTVAVRLPDREVTRRIIREAKLPLAAPSANISGKPSPTCGKHVMEDFLGRIDAVVDDGATNIGVESTIVDLTGDIPAILRRGYIGQTEIEGVLKTQVIDTFGTSGDSKNHPKAPGTKYKHYSPKATLIIVEAGQDKVAEKINGIVASEKEALKKVGVITCDERKNQYRADKVYSLGSHNNGKDIIKNLYSVLRKTDEDKMDVVFSESFSETEYYYILEDRLYRAGGGRVIREDEI